MGRVCVCVKGELFFFVQLMGSINLSFSVCNIRVFVFSTLCNIRVLFFPPFFFPLMTILRHDIQIIHMNGTVLKLEKLQTVNVKTRSSLFLIAGGGGGILLLLLSFLIIWTVTQSPTNINFASSLPLKSNEWNLWIQPLSAFTFDIILNTPNHIINMTHVWILWYLNPSIFNTCAVHVMMKRIILKLIIR